MRERIIVGLVVALAAFGQSAPPKSASKLAPFVASSPRAIDRMLELANIKPGETVFDLGAGDGRVLVAAVEKYHAKAVGVEISPKLVKTAQARFERAGVADRVRMIEGDLFQTDLTGADVVMLYLDSTSNKKLHPRLEKFLHAGARVVSKDYPVPGWRPNKVDKSDGHGTVYYYEIPATRQ